MLSMRELGEFGLIQRIGHLLPPSASVLEGVGDDCAIVRAYDRLFLMSSDLLIEDVHFRRHQLEPDDIGWKAAASCLSDIAAMGGLPMFCLLSLACPGDTDVALVEGIVSGAAQMVNRFGAAIVGGDTSRSVERLMIDMSVVGGTTDGHYLRRRGARPGDLLVVTGDLGLAAGAVHGLENGHPVPQELAQRYRRPSPRIREGQWLCSRPAVHAMMDVSDGLIQDAGHLAAAAGLGVDLRGGELGSLPALEEYAEEYGVNPLQFILCGGEDYELVFALDHAEGQGALDAFHHEFRTVVRVLGEFTEDWTGVRIDGKETGLAGFDHFTRPRPGAGFPTGPA